MNIQRMVFQCLLFFKTIAAPGDTEAGRVREMKLVDKYWSYCDVGLIKENV